MVGDRDSARTQSYISDHETQNENSEYCVFRKRQVKELSKILAKEIISRSNKKAIQLSALMDHEAFSRREETSGRQKGTTAELMEDIDLSWVAKSERFKNFTRQRQVLTINRRTEYEIEDFRRQEFERYKEPLQPYVYKQNGYNYIVGPSIRKKAQMRGAPVPHQILKGDRPPFCSILTIVRDAVARLPDGVGTRLDVTELAKESQWLDYKCIDENVLSMTIGGGLDRLQAEEDPCCRFDPVTRLWVYLHGKRKADDYRLQFEYSNKIAQAKLDGIIPEEKGRQKHPMHVNFVHSKESLEIKAGGKICKQGAIPPYPTVPSMPIGSYHGPNTTYCNPWMPLPPMLGQAAAYCGNQNTQPTAPETPTCSF